MRVIFSTVVLLAACGRPAATPEVAGDHGALVATAEPTDPIVARVGERAIRASEVALEARAQGVAARVALDSLIDAEALTIAAIDRGLLDDPDVVDAGKAARVRRLLRTVFEAETPATKIPTADYEKSYKKNKQAFDHPDAVEVWHVLAEVPSSGATPAQAARARAKIAALLDAAARAPTDEAFAALAKTPSATEEPKLKAEHLTFSHDDVEEPFAAAAFALRSSGAGATSGVVETRYGAHVIRFVRFIPARHVTLADARAELESGTLEIWRRRELATYIRGLMEQTRVEVFPDRLARTELPSDEVAP